MGGKYPLLHSICGSYNPGYRSSNTWTFSTIPWYISTEKNDYLYDAPVEEIIFLSADIPGNMIHEESENKVNLFKDFFYQRK